MTLIIINFPCCYPRFEITNNTAIPLTYNVVNRSHKEFNFPLRKAVYTDEMNRVFVHNLIPVSSPSVLPCFRLFSVYTFNVTVLLIITLVLK
jgi:hypothetical protein